MKKPESLKNISTEELLARKKKLKSLYATLAGFMLVCFVVIIIAVMKTKNYALLAVIGGCSITLIPGFSSINEISNELKEREQTKTSV